MISLLINGIRQRFLEVSMVLITFLFCFDSFVHGSFTITIQVWNTAPTHTHTHACTWGHAMNIILEGSAINHIISIPHLFQWPGPEYFSPLQSWFMPQFCFNLLLTRSPLQKHFFFFRISIPPCPTHTHTHDHTHLALAFNPESSDNLHTLRCFLRSFTVISMCAHCISTKPKPETWPYRA